MSKPDLKSCPKILIVEGYSDLTFCAEFLAHLKKDSVVFIKDMGGRPRLMVELDTFINPALLASKTHIAVIVDHDDASPDFSGRLKAKLDAITHPSLTEGQWTESGPDAKVDSSWLPRPAKSAKLRTWSGNRSPLSRPRPKTPNASKISSLA